MITYRNKNTKQVVTVTEPRARFEASPAWETIDTPDNGEQIAGRAEAEKSSIEEAAKQRSQRAALYADEAKQIAEASAQSIGGGVANVTGATTTPDGFVSSEGVLARAKGDQRSGALQVGDDMGRHPRDREGLEAKAAEDSAAVKANEHLGVLSRPDLDLEDPQPLDPDGDTPARGDDDSTVGTGDKSNDTADKSTTTNDDGGESDVEAPAATAQARTWRKYAVDHKGATEDEVADMDRAALIEKYGPAK